MKNLLMKIPNLKRKTPRKTPRKRKKMAKVCILRFKRRVKTFLSVNAN